MTESYTKLSSTLVHSTVWRESAETRVVWITLLALADQHGEVHASIPGLADASRVTMEESETALAVFLAPDPYSRSKTLEGRRIVEIPGGWSIVNYDLYRGLLNLDHRRALARDRQARHRAKKRNVVTRDITQGHGKSRQAEAEADTSTTTTPAKRGGWVGRFSEAYNAASEGTYPVSRLGSDLKALIQAHGENPAFAAWTIFLASPDRRFGPVYFAKNYVDYSPKSNGNGKRETPAEKQARQMGYLDLGKL